MTGFSRDSIEIIPEWLAATRNLDVATGLSQEEALLRASKLRHLLGRGRLCPSDIELDEDGKDLLHALVKLLSETADAPSEVVAEEADKVYRLLRSVEWNPDPFEEKSTLLRQCAEIGWQYIEQDRAALLRRRQALALESIPEFVLSTQAQEIASSWFQLEPGEASRQFIVDEFRDLEMWWASCRLLRHMGSRSPAIVVAKGEELFARLTSTHFWIGRLDETDFLTGEVACNVAGSARHLGGDRVQVHAWLERARLAFVRTVTEEWSMAEVFYHHLTLKHEIGDWQSVQAFLPRIESVYRRALAKRGLARCAILKAASLKAAGQPARAASVVTELRNDGFLEDHPDILAWLLVIQGEASAMVGELPRAFECYAEASRLLTRIDIPMLKANLKVCVGEAHRQEERYDEALSEFLEGLEVFDDLRMTAMAARTRLNVAELLLSMCREREAANYLLASLPAIDSLGMVPEGIAAVALLKEAARRCQADPNALRDLQEQLQRRQWD